MYRAAFDHAYPPHAHDGWAVMLVDDGAVSYDLGRASHIAAPGAVTILPPGISHDGRSAVDGTIYRKRVVSFDSEWLPERMAGLSVSRPTVRSVAAVAAVRRIHDALAEPGDLLAAEHWTLAVRQLILLHLGTGERRVEDAPLSRRVRSLLDERFTESFTIAEVATELGVHPSHLARSFSQTYGLAPHQCVLSRRVDLARRRLLEGAAPASAAAEAGFFDQAHLTRHFRRILGTTPRAFVSQ